jgi:hypothetical protein
LVGIRRCNVAIHLIRSHEELAVARIVPFRLGGVLTDWLIRECGLHHTYEIAA